MSTGPGTRMEMSLGTLFCLPATVSKQNAISMEAPETLSDFLDQTATAFSGPCLVQRQIL